MLVEVILVEVRTVLFWLFLSWKEIDFVELVVGAAEAVGVTLVVMMMLKRVEWR